MSSATNAAIDVLIADAVGDDVEPGVHERFGICQIEEVRCHSQVALVRFIDQRGVGLRRHVVRVAVHPGLDDVNACGMTLSQ